MKPARDAHHIIHPRQEWSLRPEAKAIRNTPSLIPELDRSVHNELHRSCPPVPLLGYHALTRVASDLYPTRGTISTMYNLMSAIENSGYHPKVHPIERELGLLAIEAIDLQRQFLIENFEPENNRNIIDLASFKRRRYEQAGN